MRNWNAYIQRQKAEYVQRAIPLEWDADMVVVIPCHNEPDFLDTLRNLSLCHRPEAGVVVLVVFNSGSLSGEKAVRQNRDSFVLAERYAEDNNQSGFSVFPLLFDNLPRKHAGVGLARKIGMDLAVEHFLRNENDHGVIVSLDADCAVSSNYLTGIWTAFSEDRSLNCTIHGFQHRVEPNCGVELFAARQYEAYIRYFRAMLLAIGFPYYWHTIGSAFAVSADAYVGVGGMGRQQGGEDFYFLQKIFSLGHVRELNDVKVFPLARRSDRVPFGTGPSLQKITDTPDGNLRAYSEESFRALKELFDLKELFYGQEVTSVKRLLNNLHPALQAYLDEIGFLEMVNDCNLNSASPQTFSKRFFHHFNAFRIIKYLNRVHPHPFPFRSYVDLLDKY